MNAENRNSFICGTVARNPVFNHDCRGKRFYLLTIESERLSGAKDVIPIITSEKLLNIHDDYVGVSVTVTGEIRTFNRHEEGKSHLNVNFFAKELCFVKGETLHENHIVLDGNLCKPPVYRKTPFGYEIADILVAVNRYRNRSDYIPCICWGRNARFAGKLTVGEHVVIQGRIQSREYIKRFEDCTEETKTVYEVSASKIDVVESEE